MPIPDQAASPLAAAPVTLTPILVERIWGVHNLLPWHTGRVEGSPVGEIWLTAEQCRVHSGPAADRTLAELTASAPRDFGDGAKQGFPLLIKLLFPREKLSVQVHPDDIQAQALGMPRGKTECWYVLSAEPGAQVAVGFREPMSSAEVKASITDGSIEGKLRMLPVKAGDMVFVDAGTVHAIGPGMVVLETQQYSDTTYRLWDYGRPRELHAEAGVRVTRTGTAAGLAAPHPMNGFTRLVSCPYFAVDRFLLRGGKTTALAESDRLQILIPLGEGCQLFSETGTPSSIPRACATVLPANGTGYSLGASGDLEVVRVLQP